MPNWNTSERGKNRESEDGSEGDYDGLSDMELDDLRSSGRQSETAEVDHVGQNTDSGPHDVDDLDWVRDHLHADPPEEDAQRSEAVGDVEDLSWAQENLQPDEDEDA